MEQSIRFSSIGGRRIAWSTVGQGPPLIFGGWWMSHLELNWRDPKFRSFVQGLGRHRTVVRYDAPGTGLSDRGAPQPAGLDEELELIDGVVEELGAGPVEVFAASSGGPVGLAYAAARPERVGGFVAYGTYAVGAEIADRHARESILGVIREHWGLGSRVLADLFMPSASGAEREAFVAFQREAASAEIAAHALESVYGFDVAERLAAVERPVLVLHRREDRAIPFRLGQDLAARLPRATFVALSGADHFPWLGPADELIQATLTGLGVEPAAIDPVAPPDPGESDLSERELEVLRLVAEGLSDREIAARLVLSPHTVHRHVANIRTRLGLSSRAAAAAHAARLGLL